MLAISSHSALVAGRHGTLSQLKINRRGKRHEREREHSGTNPTTTHPTQPSVTFIPPMTSLDVGALALAASHPTHALVTIMASTANSDAPRDESIRLFQSDATAEDSRNDLDWGSIDDEDGAFKKLNPKEGKF